MLMNVLLAGRGAAANGFCGWLVSGFEACAVTGFEGRMVAGFIVAGLEVWTAGGLGGGGAERNRGRATPASLASTIALPNMKAVAILNTQTSLVW
jgi:hypothetical protein